MNQLLLLFVTVCLFNTPLLSQIEESQRVVTDFEKLNNEKEENYKKANELDQQKENLEKQHEALASEAAEQEAARDQKEEEYERLKQEKNLTPEQQKHMGELQSELGSYSSQDAKSASLANQIADLEAEIEKNETRSNQIDQEQNAIKSDQRSVSQEINQQEKNIVQAAPTDVTRAVQSVQIVAQVVPKSELKVTFARIFEQLKTDFLQLIRNAISALGSNISRAIEQTKATISQLTKESNTRRVDIATVRQEVSEKNDDIQKLKATKGFGGKDAITQDLAYLGEPVSAQDILDNKKLKESDFYTIINNAYDDLNNDVRSSLKFNVDTLRSRFGPGSMSSNDAVTHLLSVWSSNESTSRDIFDAYNALPETLRGVNITSFQERNNVLDALAAAKELDWQASDLSAELVDEEARQKSSLAKIDKLNQRNDELEAKKSQQDAIVSSIDAIRARRAFVESLSPLQSELVKGGIDYLKTVDIDTLGNNVTTYETLLSALNPQDILSTKQPVADQLSMLTREADTLKEENAAIKDFLGDTAADEPLNPRSIKYAYGDLVEQSLLLAAPGQEENVYEDLQNKMRAGLGNSFITDKNQTRETLKKDKKVEIDLKKYGFNDNVVIDKPLMYKTDDSLDEYIRDEVFDYVIQHAYEVLGLDSNKADSYSQDQIAQQDREKRTLKQKMIDEAEIVAKTDKTRGEALELAAIDLYKGPREIYNSLATPTGKKIIDAFRKGDNQVRKLIRAVPEADLNTIQQKTVELQQKIISPVTSIKDDLKAKIDMYDKAISGLKNRR